LTPLLAPISTRSAILKAARSLALRVCSSNSRGQRRGACQQGVQPTSNGCELIRQAAVQDNTADLQQHPCSTQLAVGQASDLDGKDAAAGRQGRLAVRTGMPSCCLVMSCSVLGRAAVQHHVC
jgi:hypothetical protein